MNNLDFFFYLNYHGKALKRWLCMVLFEVLYTKTKTSFLSLKTPSFINWSLSTILEKAMTPHSSILAWKIPWTVEPGRLQSMGSLGVGHNWATSLSLFTFMHWRRKWQPTPVFLPGESQGRQALVGCCLWGRTESDTTEATEQQQQQQQQYYIVSCCDITTCAVTSKKTLFSEITFQYT